VPTAVTVASGHDSRNQRSRCRNPCGHVHRNVGHDPGITGHVGPEYSPAITPVIAAARAKGCNTSTGADMFVQVRELMVQFLLDN